MIEEQEQPKEEHINIFAKTTFRNKEVKFGIKEDDRRRHMYLVGKTGMGKSTLIENMIIEDIRAGKGMGLVDPHGDLAEKVIKFIPKDRINDVIYFNPADLENPVAFNVLENVNPEHKNLVASGLLGVFKKIWADSWGPRLEYILMNAILALLEYPGSTLLGVTRMLVDTKYRKKVVSNISDPVVKMFWVEEFANYSEKFRTEAIAPIQNKVGQFLSSLLIRNIVGQSKSTIDMRQIMDEGKILILNLSKGRIGEEFSALLGAMMVTKIQLAAMSRVDTPEEERKDFCLYVDEFQNFATESFADILSEARKYRLSLILAHQYVEQLHEDVKAAVFGNVGTMVCFRVGSTDAEELEVEFGPTFTKEDLVNIDKFHFYLRLMIDGVASNPFSAIGLPPVSGETNSEETVISVSRERYSRPRALVEEKIMRWSGLEEKEKQQEQQKEDDRQRNKDNNNRDGGRGAKGIVFRDDRKKKDRSGGKGTKDIVFRDDRKKKDRPKQEKKSAFVKPAADKPAADKPLEDLSKKKISFVPRDSAAPSQESKGDKKEGISLKDALQQNPVPFDNGSKRNNNRRRRPSQSQNNSQSQQSQSRPASVQPVAGKPEDHKMQPGQSIKV